MALNKSSRIRHFDIIFYSGRDRLVDILVEYAPRFAHYAYMLHDKDVYEEDIIENDEVVHKKGDLKKPHIHIMLDTFNACTCSAIKRLFTTEDDKPRVLPINDQQAVYEYLWHKNNPEKYQYNKGLIMSNDIDYYENLCLRGQRKDSDNIAMAIIADIRANVSPVVLGYRYGRDCILHYNQYREYAELCYDWEVRNAYKKQEAVNPVRYEDMYDQEVIPFD